MLFLANSISGFAQGISMIAIPWYFAGVLGQPQIFGKAYAIITFISMIWTFFAGSLVDRYPRKNLFMSLNIGGAAIIGSIALLGFILGHVPVIAVLGAFLTTILIYNIHYPTLYAFGQEITDRQHFSRLSSYIEIQGQVTAMLAGGMAALLLSGTQGYTLQIFDLSIALPFRIKAWSLQQIFLLDAATYVLTFLIISRIRYVPLTTRNIETGPVINRLKSGWRFLAQRPYFLLFGICTLSIFVVTVVHEFYLLSVYVSGYLGAGANVYAICQFFYSVGAICAGIFIRLAFRGLRNVEGVIILISIMTILLFLVGFYKSVLLLFLFSLMLGLCNAGSRIMRVTYIFNQVPNDVIGRVNSVFSMSHTLGRTLFISLFAMPFFLAHEQIIYAYFIFGTYTAIAVVTLLLIRNRLPVSRV